MRLVNRRLVMLVVAAGLFVAGFAAGTWRSGRVEAQNRFGQPKTVVHVVVYKWKSFVSQDDKDQAMKGLRAIAGSMPGIKNIWLKTQRNQIRDFDGVYAIEFASPDAAADYAENPKHDVWRKKWEELRENSLSFQVSNP